MTTNPSIPANPMAEFPETYRTQEITEILRWVAKGDHGVVIGSNGSGKSNIAGCLAHRPDITSRLLPRATDDYYFFLLDLNSLPVINTASLYRHMLFTVEMVAENQSHLSEWQSAIATILSRLPTTDDPVALYFALQRLHQLLIQRAGKQVVWLLLHFDECCKRLDTTAFNNLRSLRDQFKGKLSYLAFTRFPLNRLRDPAEYDDFHDIMVMNRCWVGPMNRRDGYWVATQIMHLYGVVFKEIAVSELFDLCGGLPGFLKIAYTALATGELEMQASIAQWQRKLLGLPAIQNCCREIWKDCATEERTLLLTLSLAGEATLVDLKIAHYLKEAGLLESNTSSTGFRIFSPLFTEFVRQQQAVSERGLVIRNGIVFRDGLPLGQTLAPLEQSLLEFFLQHSGDLCKTADIVQHLWPEEEKEDLQEYSNRLSARVTALRRKIEFGQPWSYIQAVQKRGYQFTQPPRNKDT